jgi:hypothetical protein
VPGVSNSSPLIYLAWLGDLELIPEIFGRILIPEAVLREVVGSSEGKPGANAVAAACKSWLVVEAVKDRSSVEVLIETRGLGAGEAETIVLAQETGERPALIDDQSAVQWARAVGIEVVRTAGVYVAAKKYELIESVQPKLDALRSLGFWLKEADYIAVLRVAGEFPRETI